MDENQDKTGSKLVATKRRRRLIRTQQKNVKRLPPKWTGFAGKTLWDWLQMLAALAIPVAIALGTMWFSYQQNQTSQQIAQDQRLDVTLDTYLRNMTDLVRTGSLRSSKPGDNLRTSVRAQTLSTLRELDTRRKEDMLNFLYEANLLTIINLDDADLSGIHLKNLRPREATVIRDFSLQYANLIHAIFENYQVEHSAFNDTDLSYSTFIHMKVTSSDFNHVNFSNANLSSTELTNCRLVGADLSSANLSHVILRNTDLSNANLNGTDLSYADLRGTKVTSEQLASAKSFEGTIMSDGSKHP